MSIGQQGIVRAPSGQITGAPSAVPANKGRDMTLRTGSSGGGPFFPPAALPTIASRVAGRVLGRTGGRLQVDPGDRGGASLRRSQEGPHPKIHSR